MFDRSKRFQDKMSYVILLLEAQDHGKEIYNWAMNRNVNSNIFICIYSLLPRLFNTLLYKAY